MKKRVFYTELAYGLGLCLLALGTAMTVYGGFGMSMVVAPAYVLHLKLSQLWSGFSFGVVEYGLQTVILLVMVILGRRLRLKYVLSFAAAVLYGLMLDGFTKLTGYLPAGVFWLQISVYSLGILLCVIAISFLFHSYLSPAAYELLVMELAGKFGWKVTTVKFVYDCCSLVIAVLLSLVLLGKLQGIGLGTVVCALCYGPLIRVFSGLLNRWFRLEDRWQLRQFLEERCVRYE